MSMEKFFSSVKLAMKSSKEYVGLDPSKHAGEMRILGYELGMSAARRIKADNIEELMDELKNFWDEYGYGHLRIVSWVPLTFEVNDCYDCLGKQYGVDIPLCSFKEGFFEGIIREKLDIDVEVKETECCGTFHERCKFVVNIPKDK